MVARQQPLTDRQQTALRAALSRISSDLASLAERIKYN
jgi:hypothetical protein